MLRNHWGAPKNLGGQANASLWLALCPLARDFRVPPWALAAAVPAISHSTEPGGRRGWHPGLRPASRGRRPSGGTVSTQISLPLAPLINRKQRRGLPPGGVAFRGRCWLEAPGLLTGSDPSFLSACTQEQQGVAQACTPATPRETWQHAGFRACSSWLSPASGQ